MPGLAGIHRPMDPLVAMCRIGPARVASSSGCPLCGKGAGPTTPADQESPDFVSTPCQRASRPPARDPRGGTRTASRHSAIPRRQIPRPPNCGGAPRAPRDRPAPGLSRIRTRPAAAARRARCIQPACGCWRGTWATPPMASSRPSKSTRIRLGQAEYISVQQHFRLAPSLRPVLRAFEISRLRTVRVVRQIVTPHSADNGPIGQRRFRFAGDAVHA